MARDLNATYELLELKSHPRVRARRYFSAFAEKIEAEDLCDSYIRLRARAPRRHDRNKRYLVGHTGITSSGSSSNRREEHLAISLWREGAWTVGPRTVRMIDYQVPLKAHQSDSGVGKVDLLGVDHSSALVLVELKVDRKQPDTPLRAFVEVLAYSAIVEANQQALSSEVEAVAGVRLSSSPPKLLVAGPSAYWSQFKPTIQWLHPVEALCDSIAQRLGIHVVFADLGSVDVEMGLAGSPPLLIGDLDVAVLNRAEGG